MDGGRAFESFVVEWVSPVDVRTGHPSFESVKHFIAEPLDRCSRLHVKPRLVQALCIAAPIIALRTSASSPLIAVGGLVTLRLARRILGPDSRVPVIIVRGATDEDAIDLAVITAVLSPLTTGPRTRAKAGSAICDALKGDGQQRIADPLIWGGILHRLLRVGRLCPRAIAKALALSHNLRATNKLGAS